MVKIEKLTIANLDILINYFFQNQNQVEQVISEFGEKWKENGYGTTFLKPYNQLFSTFWIFQKDLKIKAFGFGGPHLGLTLKELYSAYPYYTEGFIRYDDEYGYAFFKSEKYDHIFTITSKEKLMHDNELISDIDINRIQIDLYSTL